MAASVAALAGCLSRPGLVRQSFSFVAPSRAARQEQTRPDGLLEIRRVVIAAPFDNQSFTYRTGDYSFERDPYAQFLVPPAESLGTALQSCFEDVSPFRSVAQPGSLLHADTRLEVYVNKLYGDFRKQQQPEAVLGIRFVFFQARGSTQTSVLDREYTRTVPLQARTAAALVAAWNEALPQIVSAAAADFQARDNATGSKAFNSPGAEPCRRQGNGLWSRQGSDFGFGVRIYFGFRNSDFGFGSGWASLGFPVPPGDMGSKPKYKEDRDERTGINRGTNHGSA